MPLPTIDPDAWYSDAEAAPMLGYKNAGSLQKARSLGKVPLPPHARFGGRVFTRGRDIAGHRERCLEESSNDGRSARSGEAA